MRRCATVVIAPSCNQWFGAADAQTNGSVRHTAASRALACTRVAAHSVVLVHRCQEVYRELGRLVRGAATDRDDHRSLRLLYLTPEKVRS